MKMYGMHSMYRNLSKVDYCSFTDRPDWVRFRLLTETKLRNHLRQEIGNQQRYERYTGKNEPINTYIDIPMSWASKVSPAQKVYFDSDEWELLRQHLREKFSTFENLQFKLTFSDRPETTLHIPGREPIRGLAFRLWCQINQVVNFS